MWGRKGAALLTISPHTPININAAVVIMNKHKCLRGINWTIVRVMWKICCPLQVCKMKMEVANHLQKGMKMLLWQGKGSIIIRVLQRICVNNSTMIQIGWSRCLISKLMWQIWSRLSPRWSFIRVLWMWSETIGLSSSQPSTKLSRIYILVQPIEKTRD